jgi:hypothetical protein
MSLPTAGLLATAALLGASPAAAWQTLYFEHEDERYLRAEQQRSGAAFVPPVAESTELPLVVFLHGSNRAGALHLWLGGNDRDLRPAVRRVIESGQARPFIVAAPSQTRHAVVPRALWSSFNLGAFVEDTATALAGSAQVAREQVYVVGHSGAGCNPSGGLATQWASATLRPRAVASIDPCLDPEMGHAMARRSADIPLFVWWQSAVWPRSPDGFWATLTRRKPVERVDRLVRLEASGPTAHDDVVPLAFEQFVSAELPLVVPSHNEDVVSG